MRGSFTVTREDARGNVLYAGRYLYLAQLTIATHYSHHVGDRPLAGDATPAGDSNLDLCYEEESKMGFRLDIFLSIVLSSSSTCL